MGRVDEENPSSFRNMEKWFSLFLQQRGWRVNLLQKHDDKWRLYINGCNLLSEEVNYIEKHRLKHTD